MTAALPLRVVVGALMGASINAALRQQEKPYNRPDGRGNAIPLWWLTPSPCPVGSMSLDSRVAYSSPMNPVPLPPPQAVALWVLSTGAMSLQESIERFILPPEQGEVRRSRKGGGERSEPIRRMPIMPYDTERRIRNADFISIAAERQSTTLGAKGPVKLKNPPALRPVNPKNLPL